MVNALLSFSAAELNEYNYIQMAQQDLQYNNNGNICKRLLILQQVLPSFAAEFPSVPS